MLKEYRDLKDSEMSVVTAMNQRTITHPNGRVLVWTLYHHSAGYTPAGSVARSTTEHWSVTSHENGVTFGNSFTDMMEAWEVFNSPKPWYRPRKNQEVA